MSVTRPLTELTDRELGGAPAGASGRRPRRRARWSRRRSWGALALVAIAWAVWGAGIGRTDTVNGAGWPLMGRFWEAALHPEVSGDFLLLTWRSALTTGAFAVLGTACAVAIGLVGGVLTSETWWGRERAPAVGRRQRSRVRPGWYLGRGLWGLPRGTHEAVWGLFLVNVLGRDPLVGILAIAIPFGAITAKVYAELIDEAAGAPYEALRAAGVGRVSALAYAVLPRTRSDLVSYAFYRLECSIRSAVILGMIGAGGLGFQLSLSFQALQYREMWTLIYALVALSALADAWGTLLRRHGTLRQVRLSVLGGGVLVAASALELRPDAGRLFAARTRDLLGDVLSRAWPPSAPRGGWAALVRATLDTLQMSILAIAIATGLAVVVAFLAARRGGPAPRRAVAAAARGVLLLTRAIPPPVWALLVLFVLFPGPLPGAVALGVYNFGILGRLCAEVVEHLDPRPGDALRTLGAGELTTFAYATLPQASTRFAAYALYRWEVAIRETVVVGVVGAGGLGRLLEQQRAAFDYSAMLATVIALVIVSLLVDLGSASARRALR